MKQVLRLCFSSVLIVLFFVLSILIAKIYFIDRFTAWGPSMEPTIKSGEYVWINKLTLKSPRVGEIIVFNHPYWRMNSSDSDHFLLLKRIIAGPGQTVSIENGFWRNSSTIGPIGDVSVQMLLSTMTIKQLYERQIPFHCFSKGGNGRWTIKDMGPYYIPKKGDCMRIDSVSLALYRRLLKFETSALPDTGSVHIIQNDYYFVAGDNVFDSRDSRYFGPIPEACIVGKICWQ